MTDVFNLATVRSARVQRQRWSRTVAAATVLTFATLVAACPAPREPRVPPRVLRVCADPNNLPFSNRAGEGFENRLATLMAEELGVTVEYTWWPQRRGFVRNTLRAGACDVILGVPTRFELALTTRPYYRSSYAFVTRAATPGAGARSFQLRSFDDPALRHLRIGVHLVGDDYSNTPPAHALSSRGMIGNVVGYSLYGDYATPDPPSALVTAVAQGDIDVAVAWGPIAGYFANRARPVLQVTPVDAPADLPRLPFVYDISMGVRRADTELRDRLDAVIARRAADIATLLDAYHVPRVR